MKPHCKQIKKKHQNFGIFKKVFVLRSFRTDRRLEKCLKAIAVLLLTRQINRKKQKLKLELQMSLKKAAFSAELSFQV